MKKMIVMVLALIGAVVVWNWASPGVHKISQALDHAVGEVRR